MHIAVSEAACTSPAVTDAGPVTLGAVNPSRKGLYVYNANTAALFLKLGSAASSTDYTVQIPPGGFWELPSGGGIIYTGIVTARANTGGTGDAYVTEL